MTYGISAWGGVPAYKLDKLFAIQKRCIRLLFGHELSFDHSEYYQTCARARTYKDHCKPRDFSLEHTKPLFTENKLLTVHCLYYKFMLVETFKILKYRAPFGLYKIFKLWHNPRKVNITLNCPENSLMVSKQNFVRKACAIWNFFINDVLSKSIINKDVGYIIPGEEQNSDLTTPISFVKENSTKCLLKLQSKGCDETWEDDQFKISLYKQ